MFKGSDIGLLMARGCNFGRMSFLPPPVTRIAMTHISAADEPRFIECKSVALTTDPWPHSWAFGGVKNRSSKIRQDEVSCLSPSFLSFWPFMRNDRQCNILLMTVLWQSSRVVCRLYFADKNAVNWLGTKCIRWRRFLTHKYLCYWWLIYLILFLFSFVFLSHRPFALSI